MKTVLKLIIPIFTITVLISCSGNQSKLEITPTKDSATSTSLAHTLAPLTTITPSAIPDPYSVIPPEPDEQVYIDPEGWYSVNFPADWKPTEKPNSFAGEGGLFETGYLPEMGFVSYDANVCVWEANTNLGSEKSVIWLDFSRQIWGCKVFTTANGKPLEQTIFENPGANFENRFIYLNTFIDPYRTKQGNVTFSWLRPLEEKTENPLLPPLSDNEIKFWESTSSIPSNISIQEYALPAELQGQPPIDNFRLLDFVPPEALPAKRENNIPDKLPINEQLKPLGYELKVFDTSQGRRQELYRDNRILFDNVYKVSDVYTYSTETGPITTFIVETIAYGYFDSFIIQNDVITKWEYNHNDPTFAPILYQGELLWAKAANDAHVQVRKSNQEIVFNFATYFGTRLPVNNFAGWDDHWILEVGDFVIQDGEILNSKFGFQEVFNWRLIKEKPFYFFRMGQRVGISYNEQFLPIYFHDVIHGLCCGYSGSNPYVGDKSIHFFGRRDGLWYYVVIKSN